MGEGAHARSSGDECIACLSPAGILEAAPAPVSRITDLHVAAAILVRCGRSAQLADPLFPGSQYSREDGSRSSGRAQSEWLHLPILIARFPSCIAELY